MCAEPPQPPSQALPPTLLRLSPALGAWCWLPEELCAGKAPPPSWGCGERRQEVKARGFHPLLASPDPAVALPARGRRKHPSARRVAPLPTPWGKGDAGGAGRLRVDVCVCVCSSILPWPGRKAANEVSSLLRAGRDARWFYPWQQGPPQLQLLAVFSLPCRTHVVNRKLLAPPVAFQRLFGVV